MSTIRLVTLQRTKAWLRVTHDADDLTLELAINGASDAIRRYLGWPDSAYLDSDGYQFADSDGDLPSVPRVVQMAAAVLAGIMYREPDSPMQAELEHGRLPRSVTSLLYRHRVPGL